MEQERFAGSRLLIAGMRDATVAEEHKTENGKP